METLLYNQIGGEVGLRRLVERFYHHMDTRPEAAEIRRMHPADISTSVEKLFYFLSGWSGGPPLYHERFGHPMLRQRHMPFSIGKPERDQWMICMVLAIEDVGLQDPLKTDLINAFLQVADHMRNQPRD